jgi:copper chaperone CopZ
VTEELHTLADVRDVSVDLPTGQLTVTSERPIDPSDIRRVVAEAGFQVVSAVGS